MALICDSFSDFVLFPREQQYHNMPESRPQDAFAPYQYQTSSDFHSYPEAPATSYEAHPTNPSYPLPPSTFYDTSDFSFSAPQNMFKHQLQRHPSQSPSTSVSRTLDHPPSILSSTSGASARSTASSVVGSPYHHATHGLSEQDAWSEATCGLGIGQGVLEHNETLGHEAFRFGASDNELNFDNERFPNNFVGEYSTLLSLPKSAAPSLPFSVPVSSASESFISAYSTPPLPLETSMAERNVTIDTILEDINSNFERTMPEISPSSTASVNLSPTAYHCRGQGYPIPHAQGSFKSPTTPASAMSPLVSRAASPFVSQRPGLRRQTSKDSRFPSSPSSRSHPYKRPTVSPSSLHQSEQLQFRQNLFFGQSSGRFVAPLQSTCWFSLLPFHFLLGTSCRIFCYSNTSSSRWLVKGVYANVLVRQIHRSFNTLIHLPRKTRPIRPTLEQCSLFIHHHTPSNPHHPHLRTHRAMILTVSDQTNSKVERTHHILTMPHSTLTHRQRARVDSLLLRIALTAPKTVHARLVSDLMTRAGRRVDVRTKIAAATSRTSKHIC